MFKKKQITVSPKNKVYQPKYPSFSDKNPLEYPETRPYPFTYPFIQAMSVAGFTGAVMLAPLVGCKTTQTGEVPTNYANPFPLSAAGVPYMPVSFGTGLPSRLTGEEVIKLLDSIFIDEGLAITKDTLIKREGVSIPVTAYNEVYDIGYIWMNYGNYGEGMTKKNELYKSSRSEKEWKIFIEERLGYEYQSYQEDTEKFLAKRLRSKNLADSIFKDNLIKHLPLLDDEAERKAYFFNKRYEANHAAYLNHIEQSKTLDIVKDWRRDIAKRIPDPLSSLIQLYRTTPIEIHLKKGSADFKETISKELQAIIDTRDTTIWKKRHDALIELLELHPYHKFYDNRDEYQSIITDIINQYGWQERKTQFYRLEQIVDDLKISYQEAVQLEKAAAKGEYFIAPISIRDSRTIYRTEFFNPNLIDWSRGRELSELINTAQTQEEKDSLQTLLKENRIQLNNIQREDGLKRTQEAKQKALRVLEADVRRYIQWAKSQQGY